MHKITMAMFIWVFTMFSTPSYGEAIQGNLDAAVSFANDEGYFFWGKKYMRKDQLRDIKRYWHDWPEGWDSIDAAVNFDNRRAYFFKGKEYIRWDIEEDQLSTAIKYPAEIKDHWPDWPKDWDSIDAAVSFYDGRAYFFKDDKYIRWDIEEDQLSTAIKYPAEIKDHWPDWPANWDSIDAAVSFNNDRVFFFNGDQYIQWDIEEDKMSTAGVYPAEINDLWGGDNPSVAYPGYSGRTLKIIKLVCNDTTEAGEDEVFMTITVDGKEHHLPKKNEKRMNEDSHLDTWKLDHEYTFNDSISVVIKEEDSSSKNDLIGQIDLSTQRFDITLKNGSDHAHFDDQGDYTLYYEIGDSPVDLHDGFQLVVMSDPQYDFCESSYCKNNAGSSERANRWHSASITQVKSIAESATHPADKNFEGVIVNGDLTNTMEDVQIELYRELYAKHFKTYPGLGNHDYENYTPANNDSKGCAGGADATDDQYCVKEMMDYITESVHSHPEIEAFDYKETKWGREGSWSYYFDLGDYRFFQLQNHPAFENKFSAYVSTRVGSEDFTITQSFDWLREHINSAGTKNVIINMHGLHALDTLNDDPNNKYRSDYRTFQSLLGETDKVKAIFAGHMHHFVAKNDMEGCSNTAFSTSSTQCQNTKVRYIGSQVTPPVTSPPVLFVDAIGAHHARNIPVYYSGSAEYNTYLQVKFEPNKMTVSVIDSRQGGVVQMFRDYVETF